MSELSPEAKQAAEEWGKGKYHTIYERECYAEGYDDATAKERELREGDNKLIRALAEDAGIKITAPDHMLGLQWEQFHDGVMKLREELERAWGIIANAHGGDWEKESPDWQDAATRWRDRVILLLTNQAKLREYYEGRMTTEWHKGWTACAEAHEQNKQLAHQQPSASELLEVLKAMYLKHHCGYDDEGWNALGDRMQNALCNVMGDTDFCKWLDKERSKHE